MNQQQFDREKEVISIDKVLLQIYVALCIALAGGFYSITKDLKTDDKNLFELALIIIASVSFLVSFAKMIQTIFKLYKHKQNLSK